jgi:putative OPT family oligopeptide transporter
VSDIKFEQKLEPLIPASKKLPELTFKAIVIALFLTILLAASNAYLALKIGTTISASIPASVLALGILRFFKQSNVLESNIIQTAASAGEGVAAAVAFVLPAMIILHVWQDFPYWESTLVAMVGGILGVLFSIPLRRVLLDMPGLRFPEGTAIGNVLRSTASGGQYLKQLVQGGAVGSLISLCQTGFKVLSDNIQMWTYTGKSLFGIGIGLTPATFAAGYIIGFEVGISFLVGLILSWLIILPIIASIYGFPHGISAYDAAMDLWSNHLRFVGVGTMIIGGVWTLVRLAKPVIRGLKSSFASLSKAARSQKIRIPRTERDLPIQWVLAGVCILCVLIYALVMYIFVQDVHLHNSTHFLLFAAFCTVLYVLIVGFILATICGYFTGLIGSSNNPLSGVLIIAILLLTSLYMLIFSVDGSNAMRISAAVILIMTVIATIGSIANENIQDLKAGQMVGATPWKQQLMLAIGAVVATLIIAPVLELLFTAYGMAGVFPRPGMDPTQMLAAPQASLMAAVTKGVLMHQLEWAMIITGGIVAVGLIIADEILKRWNVRLPALAVGLAIYLPPEVMTPVIIGSAVSYFVKRSGRKVAATQKGRKEIADARQRGILLACGMVAGSAIMGVVLAIPFAITGSSSALAIVPMGFVGIADILGVISLIALCVWFYRVSRVR